MAQVDVLLEECMRRATIAMHHNHYDDALYNINRGLEMSGLRPHWTSPFLKIRAECYWQSRKYDVCLQDMHTVFRVGLPVMSPFETLEEYNKWMARAEYLLDNGISLATAFFTLCRRYCKTAKEHARCFVMEGVATWSFFDEQRAMGLELINQGVQLDVNTVEKLGNKWKTNGINEFKLRNYQKSKQLLQRALIVTPEDGLHSETRRSILSHLATVHFYLKEYQLALKAGEHSFLAKNVPSKDEAERWKERGKTLFKEKNFSLLIKYYSLAIQFTSPEEPFLELRSMLLSNRSIAYNKTQMYQEALEDAKECVRINPSWSKGQYRLGSSLLGLGRHREALTSFCRAFKIADTSEIKDIALQILSAGEKLEDGISRESLKMPKGLVQELIKRVTDEKDWQKLYLLFMGGAGDPHHRYGEGGLATGLDCDASQLPLELIVDWGISNKVTFLDSFIENLLKRGAKVLGSQGCDESPLQIAVRRKNRDLIAVLSRYDKTQGKHWKDKGLMAYRLENYGQAIHFLTTATKYYLSSQDQIETHEAMSEACYITKDYRKSIEHANKLYNLRPLESKASAEKWKKRGNDLLGGRNFDIMTECYTLALNYTPERDPDVRAAILSNRSMAFLNQNLIAKAKNDANLCILNSMTWFRGYSRLASCFAAEKNYQEAINQYCKGLSAVQTDKEKFDLANDVVSMAKKQGTGIKIPQPIPSNIINKLIKQAVEQKDYETLRYFFLEKTCQHRTGSMVVMRTLAHDVTKVSVPLEKMLKSEVRDKQMLVAELLAHGASPNGGPNCTRSPLQLAVDQQDYKTAANLLKCGADPLKILGQNETLDRNEGSQGLQWLRLARKAKHANQSKRAEVFYNLALEYQEIANNTNMQLEAFRYLSEMSFESGKYDECLRYGYECLRLVSTKSEVEAKRWQERGETLIKTGIYSVVPNYLTLALNYAPPNDKSLRYKLLCRRSFAYNEIDDFQQAVDDGDNATKIQPDDVEGYKCLVSCYKSLGRDSRTLYALSQCLRTEANPNEKRQYFEEAMDIAAKLPEGTTPITSEVPTSFIEQILDKAIKSHNWELLRVLYLGGGGPDQLQMGKGGLATKRVRATRIPIEDAVSASFACKPEALAAFLDHDANVNGLRGNSNPLVCAVLKEQVEVAKVLLEHQANLCVKTDSNQPLLHNVVQKAIDTGRLEMLQCFLSSTHRPDIENLQDPKGCTLYHLAMNGKVNDNKKKVIKLLMEANINPTLKNKTGKKPLECCPSRDYRNKMMSKFVKHYVPTVKVEEKQQLTHEATVHDNSQQEEVVNQKVDEDQEKVPIAAEPQPLIKSLDNAPMENLTSERKPLKSKAQYTEEKKEVSRKNIEYLIERLMITKPDELSHQEAIEEETMEVTDDIMMQEATEIPDESTETVGEDIEADDGGPETAKNDEEEIDALDSESAFENLTWEVDCTENVWKTLQSRKVPGRMKGRIVGKIRMLAEGRWSKTTCKKIKGEPEKHGILLYESKLTKGARILWEKTIAFSPRCSKDPALRLQTSVSEDGANNGGESKAASGSGTGRIYSDIIRVWSIVLDHGDLQHQIENVVKSHERGSHCIVKADLKGFRNNKSGSGNNPTYYMERSKRDTTDNEETFFPPASSKENEFHILKFYSVTSAVINTLLDGDGKTKIDFPFKVTELEHAIINLQPEPPCPIILLGRSGTGKTTCCLYRLWTEFQNYWENAATAGPYIPKYIAADANLEDEGAPGQCAESSSWKNLQTPVAEHDDADVCDDDSTNEPHIPEEEDNGAVYTPERCEHFHPLFITKNTVLCSEVQKNFKELRNACPVTKAITNVSDDLLPNRVEDIGETSWPLFIGARDWLLLLDASLPGTTFFKRAKDGSLLKKIEGWGEEDTHLHYIPEEEEGDDNDDDDDDDNEEAEHAAQGEDNTKRSKPQAKDIKREATYQVFRDELWPKMNKSIKTTYHPTLVWTEIRSFIKGSIEALKAEHGFLSLQQYQELGRKRAPNFMGDRSTVYDLFQNYRRICRSQGLFDEADLVYHLHKRLSENPELSWSIHSVYVDETQDFTQAELSLLIRCCRFQNRMFFTGDTAQSIMRGIAFRFEDLKTLFHGINAFNMTTPEEPVRIPDRLYQLTHNYRSHAGILRLASSVVNLLSHYFPESFDKLEEDRGLFDGPKPVLLESCSLSDLAMILRGNKRQTSRIEFGAHQAVLVVSEEARDNMPEELKHGLVLTIYEAKGLEFDDVLIYNFFKDSQAKKEWRVVTSYIEEKQKEAQCGTSGLVEIHEQDLILKTRPLEFQPEKHKVLNSEFKYLYTAITRARVNVWFFDQDEESRSPMFEYFRRLNLVRAITLEDEGEETATSLSSMFAESSTKEEWREQGMFFYVRDLWSVAEKCFMFGEDEFMVRKCKAQQQAQEALKHRRSNPRLMKDKFIVAATQFLECDMAKEAAVCLHNARERLLLAKLYKKMEKFAEASKFFRLVAHYEDASECMEITNNYSQAIEIVCEAKLYEKAIEVLERYNSLKIEEMEGFVPPKPNRTIERLCYKLAETHLKDGKREYMERVLQRLPSADDRISFLMKHECIEEAARALVDNNRREDAAHFLQLHGKFKAAKRYGNDFKFLGDCSLYEARVLIQKQNPEHHVEVVQLLEDALSYYRRCKDRNGEAEALLFLGRRKDDPDLISESGKIFDKCQNICGESEVIGERLKRGNLTPFYYRITVRTIERLLELIFNLHNPYTKLKAKQQEQIALCEQFFGLFKVDDARIRSCRTSSCERFYLIASGELLSKSKNMQVEVDVKDAYQTISHDLIDKAIDLTQKAKDFFMSKLEFKGGDESYLLADLPFHEKFEVLFNWVYLDSVTVKFYNNLKQLNSSILSKAESVRPKQREEFLSCKLLTEFLFPDAGFKVQHPTSEQIVKIRKHHAVKARLMQFCNDQWKSLEIERRAPITDVFLQVSRVMQVLDMPQSPGINMYLNEKEQSFLQASKKDPYNNKLIHESGMLSLKGRTGLVSYEIFLRHWEIGKKKLHVHCDVVQSLHETLRRFLTYTAKSSRSHFYPSIANTLMILEHQLTVSLILFARLKCQIKTFCCCIPDTYLKRLEFTDFLNCAKQGLFDTIDAVESHARSCSSHQEQQKCQRAIQSLQSYIVELMFGIISFDFNVFYDTFFSESSDKLISSGVADRTLILSLTMLVNCGKVLYADCEKVILHYIFTVIPHSSLPEHLKTAFQSMSEVSNISDAVKVLKNLLHARNNEKLFDVRWNYASGLDKRNSNPENYNFQFDVNVSEIKDKARAESSRPVVAVRGTEEQPEDQEEENTAEADSARIHEIEKERRDREALLQAVIKMQKRIRRKMALLKSKKLAEGKDHLDPTEDHFSTFKVDSTACTICGVDFQVTSDKKVEAPTNTLASHVVSPNHNLSEQQFEKYKDLYVSRVEPVLRRIRGLRNVDDIGLDMQQLEGRKKKLWEKVKQIESGRGWNDLSGLIPLLKSLEEKVQGIESLVQVSSTTDLDEKDEKDNDEGHVDEYEEEDLEEILPVGKQKKTQGQRSKERKKRKKGR